jgi:hypothetical protein
MAITTILSTNTIAEALAIINSNFASFHGDDFWTPAGETWTYATANTFTIVGDKTTKYQIGDKIKLTQTTAKYFYISAVAYGAPNATVTILGGSDYSLADAAITSPYFSKAENPQGFPKNGFALTAPTFTTTGTGFSNAPASSAWRFRIVNGICEVFGTMTTHATSGGTAVFIATFTAGQLPALYSANPGGHCYNETDALGGPAWCSASNVIRMCKYDGTAIAGNSKVVRARALFAF